MNYYEVEGVNVYAFKDRKEVELLGDKIDMIKVIETEIDPDNERYVFTLENFETIVIGMDEKNNLMLHYSTRGDKYKPVVNENEDDDSLDIEYVGFQLV